MRVEYRVCWSASSNITFKGKGDWVAWEDDEAESPEAVFEALHESDAGTVALPRALEEMLEVAGIDWWVETREAEEAGQS